MFILHQFHQSLFLIRSHKLISLKYINIFLSSIYIIKNKQNEAPRRRSIPTGVFILLVIHHSYLISGQGYIEQFELLHKSNIIRIRARKRMT